MEKIVLKVIQESLSEQDPFVIFQVVESPIGHGPHFPYHHAATGLEITSESYPEVTASTLYVRGTRSDKNDRLLYARPDQFEKIKQAIAAFNKQFEGKKIVIDGKEITLSAESFEALKKSLTATAKPENMIILECVQDSSNDSVPYILFRILSSPPNNSKLYPWTAPNGWEIASYDFPEVRNGSFFVRGVQESRNNRILVARPERYRKIQEAVVAFNARGSNTIVIDGKKITLSAESFETLKKSLCK